MTSERSVTRETSPSTLLKQLLSQGYASVQLTAAGAARLADLYREAGGYFGQDAVAKLRNAVPNRISGYRPFSYANSGSADKPDLNDSFVYWKRRRDALPHQEEIGEFLDAAEAYRTVAAEIVDGLLEELCSHYGYENRLPFEAASVLQINSFVEPTDAELYQEVHEDAVLLTVIWTSHPGLEGVLGEEIKPFTFAPDEVLVMPGSVLTMMTGGEIQPFFHQARNHGDPERKSIMYFVCPDAADPIEPFVRNEYNRDVDIQRLVIENPQAFFGLSEDFVTA